MYVGRKGALTPVAHVAPVFVGGTTVRNATLHNIDEIRRKDLRVGDLFVSSGRGTSSRRCWGRWSRPGPARSWVWEMPTTCPVCGTEVVRDEGEVVARCPNPFCPAQRLGGLIHFTVGAGWTSRGLGYKVMVQLVDKDLVSEPADVYRLDVETLEGAGPIRREERGEPPRRPSSGRGGDRCTGF